MTPNDEKTSKGLRGKNSKSDNRDRLCNTLDTISSNRSFPVSSLSVNLSLSELMKPIRILVHNKASSLTARDGTNCIFPQGF